jgi:aspartyl-tRNA(Asn)/glutamyl-tRNA(Gln) amidotransferase subunit A
LQTIAGEDNKDSTCLDMPVPDYEAALSADLHGLKLGLPKEYFISGMDPEVEKLVQQAVRQCEKMGAQIVDVSLKMVQYAIPTYYIIACAEASANLARFDGVRYGARSKHAKDPLSLYFNSRAEGFGQEVKRRIILGTYVLSSGYYDAYYGRAQKVRQLIRRDFQQTFEQCDGLLAPVSPTPAYKIGEKSDDPLQMYISDILTVSANLSGICGMSVPCGFTNNKLPVGLQILAPAFQEETLLKIGFAYEQSVK